MGFSVYLLWLFFSFCVKKLGFFWFRRSLQYADFLLFSIWFSAFLKNPNRFSDLIFDVLFAFSYSGSGSSSI